MGQKDSHVHEPSLRSNKWRHGSDIAIELQPTSRQHYTLLWGELLSQETTVVGVGHGTILQDTSQALRLALLVVDHGVLQKLSPANDGRRDLLLLVTQYMDAIHELPLFVVGWHQLL